VHASVQAGLQMLEELGAANDFEVVRSNGEQTDLTDPQITSAGLAPFDMLFFMNTSGDLFTDPEKQIVMDFLHEKKAFAGVHAAADTERNWAWYHELVGAFFDSHSSGLQPASMTLEPGVNHPALAGLPNPWARAEEWFTFNSFAGGQTPTGLQVLLRYGSAPLTNGPATGQPLAWAREWEGIRSFYTALGHDPAAFGETLVRKHVLGGILWAARRLDP
jgi:type 1 glutamine amidotransferase